MSKKVADEGQNKNADHGHYNDIHAIAAYLPYSDVICVDNYFGEILMKKGIAADVARYRTVVFSPNSKSQFLTWARSVESAVTPELRQTVLAVYGEKWLKPYDSILEYSRERQARER